MNHIQTLAVQVHGQVEHIHVLRPRDMGPIRDMFGYGPIRVGPYQLFAGTSLWDILVRGVYEPLTGNRVDSAVPISQWPRFGAGPLGRALIGWQYDATTVGGDPLWWGQVERTVVAWLDSQLGADRQDYRTKAWPF